MPTLVLGEMALNLMLNLCKTVGG